MEKVVCILCSEKEHKFLFNKDGFDVVKCHKCGLVYVNPRLSLNELKEFYDESYHQFQLEDSLKNLKNEKIIQIISDLIGTGGKFLDIGCSTGHFLNTAKEYFDVLGIELAEWSANFARKTYNIEILNSTLENCHLQSSSFDVVTFFEVIEHLHDPLTFLKEVNRILKPDGILALSTGNVNSLEAKIRGEKWYYFAPKFHLYYFSIKTIKEILNQTGFRIIKITGS